MLNTGQMRKSKKSITSPCRALSIKLPIAPPKNRPQPALTSHGDAKISLRAQIMMPITITAIAIKTGGYGRTFQMPHRGLKYTLNEKLLQ